ncbi:MAG: hypothetical protein RLZZ412_1318 [Verrucomicrobiota bacterium]|jgi:hypothetical protein
MASANSGVQRGNVVTGARAFVTIDGRIAGYIPNISYNINKQYAPAEGLDDIEVLEHVPVSYTVSGTISRIETVESTLEQLGLEKDNESIFDGRTVTLVVMDRVKAKKIDTLEGVSFTGMSKQLQKGMITTSSCPFVAIRRRNPDGKVT